jgi:hypothetical protein
MQYQELCTKLGWSLSFQSGPLLLAPLAMVLLNALLSAPLAYLQTPACCAP